MAPFAFRPKELMRLIGEFNTMSARFVPVETTDRTALVADAATAGSVSEDGDTRSPIFNGDESSNDFARVNLAPLGIGSFLVRKSCASTPLAILFVTLFCASRANDSADLPVSTRNPPNESTSRTMGTFSEVPATTPDPHVTNRLAGTNGMKRVPMPNMSVALANRPALFQFSTFSTSVKALVNHR
jgi:hypothetical protein